MKRLIACFLALCLLCGSALAATTFSDIEKHWAKSYIEDLAARGIVKGYADGTVLPEGNITVAEALSLLGGIFTADSAAADYIAREYGGYLSGLLPSGIGWLKDRAAMCLAGDVITEEELYALIGANRLGSPIAKEYLCVLFVRAMQLEDEAQSLSSISLDFSDAGDISAAYRPYISVLVSKGVIQGDNNNNLSPKLAVTRAVVFTMLSRTLKVLEDGEGLPDLSAQYSFKRTEGVLSSLAGYDFMMTSLSGISAGYTYNSGTAVYVDGSLSALSDSCVGCTAYFLTDSTGMIIELGVNRNEKWVQGALVSAGGGENAREIHIRDLATGADSRYDVSASAAILYEGAAAQFSALRPGAFVSAKLTGDALTGVYTYNGNYIVSGTVTGIAYGAETRFSILTDGGEARSVSVITADPPVIRRGLQPLKLSAVKLGDHVTVTVEDCVPVFIETTAQTPSAAGTVTGITLTSGGSSITVKDSAGVSKTYALSPNVDITREGAAATARELAVGDLIALSLYRGSVTEIIVTTPAVTGGILEGTVLAVDAEQREIAVLSADAALVYVSVPDTAPVLNGTGGIAAFSALAAGQRVVIRGTRTGGGSFTAAEVTMG